MFRIISDGTARARHEFGQMEATGLEYWVAGQRNGGFLHIQEVKDLKVARSRAGMSQI